eukprot:6204494-Pleurochrysis_carterae.AAC.1
MRFRRSLGHMLQLSNELPGAGNLVAHWDELLEMGCNTAGSSRANFGKVTHQSIAVWALSAGLGKGVSYVKKSHRNRWLKQRQLWDRRKPERLACARVLV